MALKEFRLKFNGLYGGRTRTRTWDPLIKSQHNGFDLTKDFSQLAAKCAVADQNLALNFPTEAPDPEVHAPQSIDKTTRKQI
jgi:hypothetical protein